MSVWSARRFWTTANAVPAPGGFAVQLDARLQRPIHDRKTLWLGGKRAKVHRAETQPAHLETSASKIGVLHFERFLSM